MMLLILASVFIILALIFIYVFTNKGNVSNLPATAKLPPVVTTHIPLVGGIVSFLQDPLGSEAHKAFFEAMDDELDQAPCYRFMIPVFGKGVVYDAPLRKRRQQMRFLGGSLRPTELKRYPGIIAKEAYDFFKKFCIKSEQANGGRTIDLLPTMADLTILTASATLHGPEVRKHLYKDVSRLFAELDKGISPLSILFPYAPTPAHRGRDKAHKGMIELFSKVIRERRAKQATEGKKAKKGVDMLQKLMDSTYKDGTPVPEHEIAGLLISALFAGQHTSSITLTWTLLFLLNDKKKGGKWLEKILTELKEVEAVPGNFAKGIVTHEEVFKMDILHACIKEALRLFPPLIFLMRRVVNKPLNVCGYTVPVGYNVWVSNAVAQRLPEVFENPDVYDPSRWLSFDIRKLPPYSFIGFGAGIHTCMGESFAFMQLRTILTVVLSMFDLEMMGKLPPASYEAMVVMPEGPNMIKFVPKEDDKNNNSKNTGSQNDQSNEDESEKIVKGPSFTKKQTDIGARTMNEEISKTYSLDEIAKHNNRDDLWIIVKGKVYDVTTYLPVHQGGDAILKWAGKDATKGVYGPQHPTTVPKLLERYYIGDVM